MTVADVLEQVKALSSAERKELMKQMVDLLAAGREPEARQQLVVRHSKFPG